MNYQAKYNWADVERFKRNEKIGLILKGIATGEDAERACELGVTASTCSNHGGRQLDHGQGTMDVLPEVVQAVRGRATIIVDGGFCRGTDVVKAIALGADTVAIGRLYCYGMIAAGAQGIVRVLELLEDEVFEALALLGVDRWSALDLHTCAPRRQSCRRTCTAPSPTWSSSSNPTSDRPERRSSS